MTGHGNIILQREADNLRTYLLAGGFLHIDDNYGMEPSHCARIWGGKKKKKKKKNPPKKYSRPRTDRN